MRLHRFYIQNQNFETLKVGDEVRITEGDLVRQIHLVFRAQNGDVVILFNNTGEWECEIVDISKKEITVVAKNKQKALVQTKRVFLVQSIIKKDKFEWVAQKCTELGVTDIIPVITQRSDKRGLDEKRLQKIIIEATEQSGWGRVPVLHPISSLEEALVTLQKTNVSIYALQMDGESGMQKTEGDAIGTCVGPEGGWGEQDVALFDTYKVPKITIGKSVLRAETAAIVGVYECIR